MIHAMKFLNRFVLIALSATLAMPALGQKADDLPDAPPPPLPDKASEPAVQPPLPPKKVPSDQSLPTVSVRTDDEGQLIEEYRINGQVYMMRVTPKKGQPYFLLDSDGDGNLETTPIDGEQVQPVFWKLFAW